jgi:hypothetical protein
MLRTRLLAAKGKMRQPGKRTGVEDEEIVAAITSSTCSVCIFCLFNVLENTDQSDGSVNSFSYLWFVTGKLCLTYECTEDRYIELPFLDPVNDLTRINTFFNFVSLFSWMDYC